MTTVYELMAHLRVQNHISPELLRIEQGLSRVLGAITTGHAGFKDWGLAVKSFGAILAGAEGLGVIVKVIEKIAIVKDELVKIKNLGGPAKDMVISGAMSNRALEISKSSHLPMKDTLKIFREMHSLVDSPVSVDEAMKIWPVLADYQFNHWASKGFKGDAADGTRKMLRGLDALGRLQDKEGNIDSARLIKQLDQIQQIESLTGTTVNADTVLGLGKQLGSYGRALSDEGFMANLFVSQIIGGPRTGTAGTSMWQQLGAGVMTAAKAASLEKEGILPAGSWRTRRGGSGVDVTDEGLKATLQYFSKNPMDLAKRLRDQFAQDGITDEAEQLRIISRTFGRATTQRLAAELVFNYKQLLREISLGKQGAGVEQTKQNYMDESITANWKSLEAAWDRLIWSMAGEDGKMVIKFLQNFTDFLDDMATSIRKIDPETLKKLAAGFTALSVSLALVGIGGVIAAIGKGGWFFIALTTLSAVNWDNLKAINAWIQGLLNLHLPSFLSPQTIDRLNRLDEMLGLGKPAQQRVDESFGALQPKGPSDEPTNPNIHRQSFNPGIDNKQILQPVMIKLDLDGRLLGQAVADILEDLFTHDMQAPFANRRASYSGPGQVQTG